LLFNSLDFAIFLPVIFALYWFVFNKSLKLQNILIVASSYFFYAWWDWRFLGLIIFSTVVDYFVGLAIVKQKNKSHKKLYLIISIVVNLGLLGFFKYYNFFIENFKYAFSFFGRDFDVNFLHIILPVGISFYTFQTMSYSLDIYRGKLSPTKDFVAFASFVCFFPQLVAGPIERATNFLPQFHKKRNFNKTKAVDGLKQMLWGFFKKMVIADNCAVFVDDFFANYSSYSGSALLLGAFLFTIQIYCDFSGYSDIAIGLSRQFGFNLKKNFAFPYFSRNMAEFWRRWHISLTTWFKDYFYIPIGGSRGSKLMQLRNTFLIFIVIGFWHGAHWKFVVYGMINALHFVPYILSGKSTKYKNVVAKGRLFPSRLEFFSILRTLSFLVLVRVFFRADSLQIALGYLAKIFSPSLFTIPEFSNKTGAVLTLFFIAIFFIVEWLGRDNEYAIESLLSKWSRPYKLLFYYLILFTIFYFNGEQQQFIYFQF